MKAYRFILSVPFLLMIIGGVTAETEKPEKMPLSEIVFFVH